MNLKKLKQKLRAVDDEEKRKRKRKKKKKGVRSGLA
jgi:ribosome assembly protein YihI (activator of Der GTPase)